MSRQTSAFGIVREFNIAVPMRDGVQLSANVFRPDQQGPFPGLLLRTPYGKPDSGCERLVRAGYAVVVQDCRGRYGSEGEFHSLMGDCHREAEDGYDSVEWLAARPWCNGKVGTFGVSYNAWTQWMLAKLRPPHLAAMAPWSIPQEAHQINWTGSFRPGSQIRWLFSSIAPDLRKRAGLAPPHTREEGERIWTEIERGQLLGSLPQSRLAAHLPSPLDEELLAFLRDPMRLVWSFGEAHRQLSVPSLSVTGWFDHCCSIPNFLGAQKHGRTEEARKQARLIIGPYAHGTLCKRQSGEIDFGPDAELDEHDLLIRWFDHWLKGIPNGVEWEPPVRYFVMGSGVWKSACTWPPKQKARRIDYLAGAGKLLPQPLRTGRPDRYIYDPANPVPTLGENFVQTATDRARLDYREDILRYRTPPLSKELEIAGHPEVILHATSSAPDTDFFVHLCMEDKSGRALEIAHGMVRARYRQGYSHPKMLEPGRPTEFRIRMGPTACCFAKGTVIRLEISSSDFPNYDRNHNRGDDDLFDCRMAPAEQTILHSARHPSRLILPVTSENYGI